MSVARALRTALPHLNVAKHATPLLCEHRLAARSHALSTRDGWVYGTHFNEHTSYLPYYAARPVAPHIGGLRTSGFRGAAAWGASLAVSLLRHEAPNFTMYYALYINPRGALHLPAADRSHGATTNSDEVQGEPLWKQALPYMPYMPMAFGVWELLFGTGLSEAPERHRGPHRYAWYERVRSQGVVGLGIKAMTDAAEERRNTLAESALLGAACICTVVNQVPRIIGMVFAGAVAGFGAAAGLAHELVVRLALRFGGHGEPSAMQDAVIMQRELIRARMRELDDTQLPAPLIDALWRGRTAYEHNVNYWSNLTQAAADLCEHLNDPRLALFRGAPRRWGHFFVQEEGWRAARPPRGRAEQVPMARHVGRGAQNVHGIGRDAATRRSLARLLTADPLTAAGIATTLQEIDRALVAVDGAFRSRRHSSGRALWEAAQILLSPDVTGGVAQFYPAIKDARSTYNVDDHGIVSMRTIAAVVWRAIPENVREERREAYFSALADAVDASGYRLCQGGQCQRLVLILQGFVAGVQVEAYDAAAPVAQFVTLVTQRIDERLGDHETATVRAAYDAAYLEGCAVYQGAQREALRDQLCACAQALYDVAWAPRV